MNSLQNGVLIIDKPAGITSAEVIRRIKRLLKVKKAGHAGTLDPFATGVLICCIGKATKLCRFFLSDMKKYEATIRLGIKTDTYDLTGEIIAENKVPNFGKVDIENITKKFTGTIKQTPPVYSALKHKGMPLYKLARAGKPVIKPEREVFVHYIKTESIKLPYIGLKVACSAGTYIRSLGADIGDALGCGGSLIELRRIYSSGFDITEAISFEKFENKFLTREADECIIAPNNALKNMTQYKADVALCEKIAYGKKITTEEIPHTKKTDGIFKVVNENNELVAILNYDSESRYNYCCVFI